MGAWRIEGTRTISYEIIMTRDVFDPANVCLRTAAELGMDPPERIVVSDTRVWELYGAAMMRYGEHHGVLFHVAKLVGTESEKTMTQVLTVMDACAANTNLRRRTPIVAFGGGTVLDIAGLAAALYRRGVPVVRIPTTLLGMIDAGVGVKTGVNFAGRKSLVGSYHAPSAVLIDPGMLESLTDRELASGLAEAIKIALVRDRELFEMIEDEVQYSPIRAHSRRLDEILARSITAMAGELAGNLWEERLERLADFGHSFGPGIEMAALPRLSHGEAVAIDMALSAVIAERRGLLNAREADRILRVLQRSRLPIWDEVVRAPVLALALSAATSHRDGLQRIPLLTEIGAAVFVNDISIDELEGAARALYKRVADR